MEKREERQLLGNWQPTGIKKKTEAGEEERWSVWTNFDGENMQKICKGEMFHVTK